MADQALSGKSPATAEAEFINGKRVYRCGTLTYTSLGVFALFIWMMWGGFCYGLMERLTPRLMPVLLRQYRASNFLIGLMIGSIPAILNFIINPIVSTWSDRTRTSWGRRRPFLLFGTPFVVLFLILIGWSDPLGTSLSRWIEGPEVEPVKTILILLAIFLVGFQFFNLFISGMFNYIFADVVPKEFLGRFTSFFSLISTTAGVIFGRYIMPLADNKANTRWIFTGIALLYLIGFTLMCFKVKEGEYPPPEKVKTPGFLANVKTYAKECFSIRFYLFFFFAVAINTTSNICRTMFELLFANEDLHMSIAQYGYLNAIIDAVAMIAYIPMGYLVDKIHPIRIYIFGGILIIIINIFGYFFCYSYLSFGIVSFLVMLSYVIQSASGMPLTISLFPKEKYGQFCSANAMVSAVILIMANAGGGFFIDCFGYRFIFVWDFIFTVIAMALMLKVYSMWKKYGGDKNFVPPQREIKELPTAEN